MVLDSLFGDGIGYLGQSLNSIGKLFRLLHYARLGGRDLSLVGVIGVSEPTHLVWMGQEGKSSSWV